MQSYCARIRILVIAVLVCFVCSGTVHAGSGVETAGDVLTAALPAAAGWLMLENRDGTGAWQFAGAAALTLGATYLLKYTISEERPNHEDHHSFPSAHTSVSFSSAEFIRKRYGWEYGIPAYAAASFVAYSRVDSREHYAHDVIAGAAIGIASSYLLTRPYMGLALHAEADRGYYGIRLSRDW
jgi:membrane-associated phospholipid phosphatase